MTDVTPYTDELIYGRTARDREPMREAAKHKDYLTLREAGAVLNKTAEAIRLWTRAATDPLPAYRFPDTGPTLYVRRAELIDYAATHPTRHR